MVPDQTGVVDIEAAGGAVGRNVGQRGTPTPMLPPEQRIMEEEEVKTPPRREAHGHGSRRSAGTSVTSRRDTSIPPNLYGRPDKGRRTGPTE